MSAVSIEIDAKKELAMRILQKNLVIIMSQVVNTFIRKPAFNSHRLLSALLSSSSSTSSFHDCQILLSNELSDQLWLEFAKKYGCRVVQLNEPLNKEESMSAWSVIRSGIQLDCVQLTDYYLSGKSKLMNEETMSKWNAIVTKRLKGLQKGTDSKLKLSTTSGYNSELQESIQAVQTASFISRSLQFSLLNLKSISKDDSSPVTIADFTVQAYVIDRLSHYFPNDRFIAEEDSSTLRLPTNSATCDAIITVLETATGESWTRERLYETLDKGKYEGSQKNTGIDINTRVWVLDPVDGTKGFLRGQHFCIALALLVDGLPQLSVLGCPNLSLTQVLQSSPSQVGRIGDIPPPVSLNVSAAAEVYSGKENEAGVKTLIYLFPPSSGSIYYAVSGQGAYAKSLGMPNEAAYEVQTSNAPDPQEMVICESSESTHGNRDVTAELARNISLKYDFLRLDGQCKYCAVGAGAAQANLRLPPRGYREKIWDHAAGYHFVTEAGGKVTDLHGKQLDFSKGRYLSETVEGIVATSGLWHDQVLERICGARAKADAANGNKTNVFGQA